MSLKDRLNINTNASLNTDVEGNVNPAYTNIFEKIIEENANIIVCCPINVSTADAINFLGSKISKEKRIVAIGSNLSFNQNEVIKFEPDINNLSKNLIKTSLDLNPAKIILQEFNGIEAVDIFKLVNADIKNVIAAVTASSAQKALAQVELNLYLNGVNIPLNLMRNMIFSFVDKIVTVEKIDENNFYISKIYEIKSVKNNEYVMSDYFSQKIENSELIEEGFNKNSIGTYESSILKRSISIKNKTENLGRKGILSSKLKRKNSDNR